MKKAFDIHSDFTIQALLEIGISPYYFVAEHSEWPINDVAQKIGQSIDEKLHTKNCFYATRQSLQGI